MAKFVYFEYITDYISATQTASITDLTEQGT